MQNRLMHNFEWKELSILSEYKPGIHTSVRFRFAPAVCLISVNDWLSESFTGPHCKLIISPQVTFVDRPGIVAVKLLKKFHDF